MPITKESLARLKRAHQKLAADTSRAQQESLEGAGNYAKSYVADHPTFRPRTGHLQRSTTAKVVRTRGGHLLKIGNTAKYAKAIESGSRPHVINAKPGKTLAFRGRGGGMVFRKRVMHPGTRPHWFLYKSAKSSGRVHYKSLQKRLAQIASRF